MNTNKHSTDKPVSPEYTRLPCRGCTKNCNDYNRCNGKPWRLIENEDNKSENKT